MTPMKYLAKSIARAFLKNRGIDARESKLGINFVYDGWNFLLWNDLEEPSFFRLTLPGIYDVTDATYARSLMACNTVNWNYKVVKASLYEFEEDGRQRASVWVCYEQRLDSNSTPEVMERAVAALIETAEKFQTLVES